LQKKSSPFIKIRHNTARIEKNLAFPENIGYTICMVKHPHLPDLIKRSNTIMMESIFTIEELKKHYETIQRLMSQLQEDHMHTQKALDMLEKLPAQPVPGDIAGQAKANAAMDIVKVRETTNQKLLEAYIKMYDDLREVIFRSTED
jgi:hypothetical protein